MEKETSRIRWRPKELNPAEIADADYRKFITDSNVVAMDLEELNSHVIERLRRGETIQDIEDGVESKLVIIDAAEEDEELAHELGETIEAHELDWEIAGVDEEIGTLAEQQKARGVLIVYGKCSRQWVRKRCREIRPLLMKQKPDFGCGVFIEPPDENTPKKPLGPFV